jgi:hypothetical protein
MKSLSTRSGAQMALPFGRVVRLRRSRRQPRSPAPLINLPTPFLEQRMPIELTADCADIALRVGQCLYDWLSKPFGEIARGAPYDVGQLHGNRL